MPGLGRLLLLPGRDNAGQGRGGLRQRANKLARRRLHDAQQHCPGLVQGRQAGQSLQIGGGQNRSADGYQLGHQFVVILGESLDHAGRSTGVLLRERQHQRALETFLQSLIRAGLKFLLFVLVVTQLGVKSSSLVAMVGAAGLAVGLALQGSLANFAGGVLILLFKPFKVGDFISAQGVDGTVKEISIFTTKINTFGNQVAIVPNGQLSNNNIINYSKNMGQSGLVVHTTVTIGYDVPWQTVNDLLIGAAKKTEGISSHPEPFVLQTSLDDNYVSYELNGWTRKPEELPKTYSELHANILDEFHGHNVEITSPAFRAVRDGNTSTIAPVIPRETEEEGSDEGGNDGESGSQPASPA